MLKADLVLAALRNKVDHPATVRELLQRLQLPREQHGTLRRRLRALVESGVLIKVRGNRYGLSDRMRLVRGRVQVNPKGFGFVTPDEPVVNLDGDLYVAGINLNEAMHGDRVVARVESQRVDGRAEGRIVRILEHATNLLVGRLEIDESGLAYVVPSDRRFLMDVHIPSGDRQDASPGKVVVAELIRWPTATRSAVGRVTEVLGDIDAPGVETKLIIRKFGIPDSYPPDAIAEARALGDRIRPRDITKRTDFRAFSTVTIDGETARDFDDAITLKRLPNGNFWLGVHIADVSHYVPEGGPLDRSAYDRGTSVYFPERAVHMFPEELSTGLCSLNPNADRLVQSCLMEIDETGDVRRYEIHDGVIQSDARMTYTEVNAILKESNSPKVEEYRQFVPLLELMAEAFEVLHKRRRRRGSIDFDLPAAEFLTDDEGRVEAVVAAERNIAHRLIEEFMLVANETVAAHLQGQKMPVLYRVHEGPEPTKVKEFEAFTASIGYSLGVPADRVRPQHFQRLLGRVRDTAEERAVAVLMLRTMQQARYDTVSLGHFGLATRTYTHFTSPIRRYPDLVVHRALRMCRQSQSRCTEKKKSSEPLRNMARHTSEMERRAENAEREAVQWRKVRFMSDKVGDEFTGWVTGVTAFGLFVELIEHFVEGLVHISSMADDYYRFSDQVHELRGENTRKVYRIGNMVRVQLVRVDREHRKLELALVDVLESVRKAEAPTRVPRARSRARNVPRRLKRR